jgi:surfactin synthase thioesterase subunit
MGFPLPNKPIRQTTSAQLAANTKEDEAVLNLLFEGNHYYLQRHTNRLIKLIAQLESI